jgi:hypothetical protein
MVRWLPLLILTMPLLSQANSEQLSWHARSSETYKGNTKKPVPKSAQGTVSPDIQDEKSSVGKGEKSSRSKAETTSIDAKNTRSLSAAQQQKARSFKVSNAAHPVNNDIWIYDARTRLLEDYDHDNYFYVFKVSFDVDTLYSHADLYARLYLGDGEIYREYHTTSVFHIDDTDGDDEFTVETELLSGYASWDYDVLIEIYEAGSDHLVAVYDNLDDADLSYLPLESYDYEYRPATPSPPISRSREHGGSLAFMLLPVFALLLFRRFVKY